MAVESGDYLEISVERERLGNPTGHGGRESWAQALGHLRRWALVGATGRGALFIVGLLVVKSLFLDCPDRVDSRVVSQRCATELRVARVVPGEERNIVRKRQVTNTLVSRDKSGF